MEAKRNETCGYPGNWQRLCRPDGGFGQCQSETSSPSCLRSSDFCGCSCSVFVFFIRFSAHRPRPEVRGGSAAPIVRLLRIPIGSLAQATVFLPYPLDHSMHCLSSKQCSAMPDSAVAAKELTDSGVRQMAFVYHTTPCLLSSICHMFPKATHYNNHRKA